MKKTNKIKTKNLAAALSATMVFSPDGGFDTFCGIFLQCPPTLLMMVYSKLPQTK